MAINIPLNLKTINGQPISGSGDMVINTINWRGSFSTAPLSPSKYDTYHNTTNGNAYIFNGTTWGILARKGGNSSNSSSRMFFPHETLTSEDVGKLVIWKDGKAQLPVFEPAVEPAPTTLSVVYNKSSYELPKPVKITVKILSNTTSSDSFHLRDNITVNGGGNSKSFLYQTSPSSGNYIQIGADIEETVANTVDVLNLNFRTPYITAAQTAEDTFEITYNTLFCNSFETNPSFNEHQNLIQTYSEKFDITEEHNDFSRLGDFLSAYLFFVSLKVNNTRLSELAGLGDNPLEWFLSLSYRSGSAIMTGYDGESPQQIAGDLSEFKQSILDALLFSDIPEIEDAWWESDQLLIIHNFSSPLQFDLLPGTSAAYNYGFEDLIITEPATPAIPIHCKYPILGLVKAVTSDQVEIHTEPICSFKLTGDSMTWNALSDFQRFCVLNPDEPGYLMSLANIEINAFEQLFTISEAGYVIAIDKNVTSGQNFYGSFSLDRFALSLLKTIITEEEED